MSARSGAFSVFNTTDVYVSEEVFDAWDVEDAKEAVQAEADVRAELEQSRIQDHLERIFALLSEEEAIGMRKIMGEEP